VICSAERDAVFGDESRVVLVVLATRLLDILEILGVTAEYPDVGAQDVGKLCGGFADFLY